MVCLPDPSVAVAAKLLSPRVADLSNPGATLRELCAGKSTLAFAHNAQHSALEVEAKMRDILVLALQGLLVISLGRAQVAAFPLDSESFVHAANRLQKWDPELDVEALPQSIPLTGVQSTVNELASDAASDALKSLCDGGSVAVQMLAPVVLFQREIALVDAVAGQESQ